VANDSGPTQPRPVSGRRTPVVTMSLSAVAIVMVFLSTFLFQLPILSTNGYFNFGDIMIFTFAFTFGPVIGGISGAVGSMLSDALSGFGTFAPFTFIIKGLEGFLAGLISQRQFRGRVLFGWAVGSVTMVAGYFFAEYLFIAFVFGSSEFTGLVAASGELPFNILQVVAGGLVGIPLSLALKHLLKQTPYYYKLIETATSEKKI
jgi:uncharacterized membrane protein